MQPKDLDLLRLETALAVRNIRIEEVGGRRFEAVRHDGVRFALRPYPAGSGMWIPGRQILDLCGRFEIDARDVYEDALLGPASESDEGEEAEAG